MPVCFSQSGRITHVRWQTDRKIIVAMTDIRGFNSDKLFVCWLSRKNLSTCWNETQGEITGLELLGEQIVASITENAITRLYSGGCSGPTSIITGDGSVQIRGVTNGHRIVFSQASPERPSNLAVWDKQTRRAEVIYRTKLSVNALPMKPQATTFLATDGVDIPSFFWLAKKNSHRKLVIMVHGGPHLHEGNGWNSETAAMLENGYSVLRVNYRGSSGYGSRFQNLGSVYDQAGDVSSAVDYAVRTLGFRPNDIVIVGESFGAYLVTCAASRIDTVGGIVLLSTLPAGTCLDQRNPVECPLLVFHGANDPIAPASLARSFVEREYRRGGWLEKGYTWTLFRNEGHHFNHLDSLLSVYRSILSLAN